MFKRSHCKEPINLACSHGVCKTCLPIDKDTAECKICGTEQIIISHENFFIQTFIERNVPGLFDKLENWRARQFCREYQELQDRRKTKNLVKTKMVINNFMILEKFERLFKLIEFKTSF